MPSCTDSRFPRLTEIVQSGKCVAFVGAGMSRPEYPDWNQLIEKLALACKVNLSLVDHIIDPAERPLHIAELAKATDEAAYIKCLCESFADLRSQPDHYHMLARIPFKSFVTTNFDSFLPKTLNMKRDTKFAVYPSLSVENHGHGDIFFIHGKIDFGNPRTALQLVLTSSQFQAAYEDLRLTSFLYQTFLYNDVCFLGCSLSDGNLRRVVAQCHKARTALGSPTDPEAPKWFCMVEQDGDVPSWFDALGIEAVRYNKRNSDHDGLKDIIREWSGLDEARPRRPFERSGGNILDAVTGVPR